MKTKQFLALAATLVFGIMLGVIGSRFVTRMNAYARVSMHVIQGRAIMKQITEYRYANGVAPDQRWFSSLDDTTKTSEGFQWVYLNPPLILNDYHKVIILTATNDNNRYLCGIPDYGVVFSDLHNNKDSEQGAPSNR